MTDIMRQNLLPIVVLLFFLCLSLILYRCSSSQYIIYDHRDRITFLSYWRCWYDDSDCHHHHLHDEDKISSSTLLSSILLSANRTILYQQSSTNNNEILYSNNNNNSMIKLQNQKYQLIQLKQQNKFSQIRNKINRRLMSTENRVIDIKTNTNNDITLIDNRESNNYVMNQHELLKSMKDEIYYKQQQRNQQQNQRNDYDVQQQQEQQLNYDQILQENIDILLSTYQGNGNTNKYDNNLTAIIHIGPQKTGSSSIQQFMIQDDIIQSLFIKDHYSKVPDVNVKVDKSFASCFNNHYDIRNHYKNEEDMLVMNKKRHPNNKKIQRQEMKMIHNDDINNNYDYDGYNNNDGDDIDTDDQHHRRLSISDEEESSNDKIDYKCHTETIQQTIQLALHSNNLIFTSETLSNIKFNVSKFYNFINMYYNHVNIIIYYRRYFSWIISLHNQQNKNSNDIAKRISIVDYLNNHIYIKKHIYDSYYFIGTIRRFQKYFNIDTQIKYYHLNHLNQPSIIEHFYCTAIPNANNTCQVTKDIIKQNGVTHSNSGIDFIYQDLAYYAKEFNLISSEILNKWSDNDKWINKVAKAAKYHQYYTLNIKNSYDFGNSNVYTCPQYDTLHLLWNLTIQAEQEYFPQYYNDSSINDKDNEVLSEFVHYIDTYKFCHINASMILYNNNNQWTEFFYRLSIQSVQDPILYPIIL